jgi:hypothetical protein
VIHHAVDLFKLIILNRWSYREILSQYLNSAASWLLEPLRTTSGAWLYDGDLTKIMLTISN